MVKVEVQSGWMVCSVRGENALWNIAPLMDGVNMIVSTLKMSVFTVSITKRIMLLVQVLTVLPAKGDCDVMFCLQHY